MRVLVLSWDARDGDGGPSPQAAGLARALAAGGDDVRVVTRLGADAVPVELPGVEVHGVADAPPIVPSELDGPLLASLAFAARATSVAVRTLRERPVDLVHAEGWQTGPVVAALRTTSGVPVVAALTAHDLARDGDDPDAPRGEVAAVLARDADRVLVRSEHDRSALAAAATPTVVLPPGVQLPDRTPGPPPARGPLHLVAPPTVGHRELATAVRGALSRRRRITRSWRRRPFAAAVLDPYDLDAAVRAVAQGVPLLAVAGPVGELATSTGGGSVVAPTGAAVAAALDRLVADPARAAALGGSGAAAAAAHGWGQVAAAYRAQVAGVLGVGPPHLHATGCG